MYKIKAKIVGLSPIRFNRFIETKKNQANKKKMTEDEQIEDALIRSYKDDNGFYVPRAAIKKTIVNGGKKVKVGRGAASKSLLAILIFESDKFYLTDSNDKIIKDYKIQSDVVRIPPVTGARVTQYWVILENWNLKFEAIILDAVFPSDAVKEAIEYAGLYYGLLDGRPELGRFMLDSFEVVKIKK